MAKIALITGVTGKDISIRELAETIRTVIGFKGELQFDTTKPEGAPKKLLDITRLTDLGWQATTNLQEGLESTYQWYLNNKHKFNIYKLNLSYLFHCYLINIENICMFESSSRLKLNCLLVSLVRARYTSWSSFQLSNVHAIKYTIFKSHKVSRHPLIGFR